MPTSARAARVRLPAAAAAVAAATTLAGCSLGAPAPDRQGATGATPRTMHRSFAVGAEGYAPITATFPARPIATRPARTGVTFELYQVRRSARAVTVVFALHNAGSKPLQTRTVASGLDGFPTATGLNTSRVALVDPAGLKEYQTFLADPHDLSGPCVCSTTLEITDAKGMTFEPGERRFYANQVAAPPASVTSVTVQAGIAAVPDVRIEG